MTLINKKDNDTGRHGWECWIAHCMVAGLCTVLYTMINFIKTIFYY